MTPKIAAHSNPTYNIRKGYIQAKKKQSQPLANATGDEFQVFTEMNRTGSHWAVCSGRYEIPFR